MSVKPKSLHPAAHIQPRANPARATARGSRVQNGVLLAAFPLAIAACTVSEPGPPVLPGYVNAPPPPMAAPGDALFTNTLWSWQGTQMSDGTRIAPDAPARYTLEFQPGGMVSIGADCNRGTASYLLNGTALTFGPIATTRMMCPSGSRDTEFLKGLGAVSGQNFRGNNLILTLKADSGSMQFTAPLR